MRSCQLSENARTFKLMRLEDVHFRAKRLLLYDVFWCIKLSYVFLDSNDLSDAPS